MRPAPADYANVLSSAILRPCWEVTSWLGPRYLGKVDVRSGLLTETASEVVTGRLDLTVPNEPQWRPSKPTAPLAWYGQQVRIRTGWKDPTGKVLVWFDLGRYRIRKPQSAVDVLTVAGDSLQQLIVNAQFTAPTIFFGTKLKARVKSLVKNMLPVKFDPALADRDVKRQTYERDRMEALTDTLAAWPAQLEILPSGVAYISTPWESRPSTVQATYSDGPGGTLLDVTPSTGDDADQSPNSVSFSSEPDDGKKVLTESAYVKDGPMAWGGPYGFIPDFQSSPLLTTRKQLQDAASARLARFQRTVQQVTVTMVDDPRIQLGDVIRVKSAARNTDVTGRVITCQHGLTPADRGSVEHTLSVLSGKVDGVPLKMAPGKIGVGGWFNGFSAGA